MLSGEAVAKKLSDNLQKLQNRANRVLTFSNYDADKSQLMDSLNWKKT